MIVSDACLQVSATSGPDAELVFPRLLHEAAHDSSVTSLGAPLAMGPLRISSTLWYVSTFAASEMPAEVIFQLKLGTMPTQVKAALGIKSSTHKNVPLIADVPAPNEDAAMELISPALVDESTNTSGNPVLEDFALIKRLGAGAFGTIFLANHKPSGVRVALKAISKVPRDDNGHSRRLDIKELEQREQSDPGFETLNVENSTWDEFCTLQRVRGEDMILQIYAAFHDLRYYYIASVSSILPLSPW